MRTIVPPTTISDEWSTRAATAELAVLGGAKPDSYSSVWRDTKSTLQMASHSKCWYCESRQIRSDNSVDHFRPKSVYPWLAFRLSNFRFACTFCNSVRRDPANDVVGGKGASFPLLSGGRAVADDEVSAEDYLLLDPCIASDVELLDFLTDGSCCPRYRDGGSSETRARGSIDLYGLNYSALVEERRVLALKVDSAVGKIDLVCGAAEQGEANAETLLDQFLEELITLLVGTAEYSAFARRSLERHRARPWVDDLLAEALV